MNDDILLSVRNKTKADLKDKLALYKRCAVPRCTGFGKTWLLSELAQEYDTVLYLYPAKIIKQTAIDAIDSTWNAVDEDGEERSQKATIYKELGYELDYHNIRFMTYTKLARMNKEDIEELPKYSLIIMDEAHRLGGEMTKAKSLLLMYYQKNAHVVGATATPDRMDTFDVIAEFFKGICVYQYTLHDAIQDGIIEMPIYIYCTYDLETSFKKAAKITGQDMNNPTVRDVLDSKLFEVSSVHNIPNIVKKTTEEYVKEKSYMKYIVFFPNIQKLQDRYEQVEQWFKEAFPEYSINTMFVTSENNETRKNINRLNLKHKDKTIDLIACVDMLNMGYHVNDLTGIVMYRCTSSSIIYIQQFGRALSAGSKNQCIVFDIVDNLHRKSLFSLAPKKEGENTRKGITKKDRAERLIETIKNELTGTEYLLMKKFINDELEAEDQTAFDALWKRVNELTKEDIYAVDHLATYRELIAKTIAEVKYARTKRAAEEYFRMQIGKCNREIPKTIEELNIMKSKKPELQIFLDWQRIEEKDILEYILKPGSKDMVDVEKIQKGIKESMAY